MSADFSTLHEPLVEWVYDRTRTDPLGGVPITEFGQSHGLTENQTYRLLQFCKVQRLLGDRDTTHDGPEANLTPRGLEWMEERRRRRADPAARAAAARKGLLVWLWHRKHDDILLPAVADVLNDPLSLFEGERLTDRDIDRASAYLSAKGLIKGDRNGSSDGPVQAEITAEGEDCVDNYQGDIGAYERRNTSGNTTFHIGQNTGNIAANSRDFTLNATTNSGVDLAQVVMAARALRQAVPILGLPEDDAAEITQLATRMEEEATSVSPDPSRLQRWGAQTLAVLSPVASGALGSVLAAYLGVVLPGLPTGG
ncbi:hypothetical protein [Streptomyces europaeiscabiei]|uniref:hypothetical protein n=1 Tax=Streptomyces europaeiscabiei TaxID=146819 RepID=UPI002E271417|nr:hypothetical protein OG858_00030 [Streptomyces europaeiscabiei]WUD38178.1 hypothetical protein OG858_46855 [Streptomyces europaeiscabiei]